MADVTMPQLGETVTEGTITKWLKQVGDTVKEDDVLFEVSTDKVDSEVPSPVSGTLSQVLANEGDTVAVGATIAVVSAGDAGSDTGAPVVNEPAPGESADELAQRDVSNKPIEGDAPSASAPAAADAPAKAAPSTSAPAPSRNDDTDQKSFDRGGKVLSPIVRKLLSENNLDPSQVQGTGAGGRITRDDVMAAVGNGGRSSAPASSAPSAPASAQSATPVAPAPVLQAAQGDERIPFSNMRRRTAEHMIRSKATSAHTLVVIDVDYDNVEKVRKVHKKRFKEETGASLTYLPFIARAIIDTLREFPIVNSSVGNDELIVHKAINLGFAVDLSFEGLIVPVVQSADGKRMRAIATELTDLASRARNRKLGADDIANGTFTITNAGGYGTFITAPVINQPQVAILSTDGVKKRPVAIELPDGSDAIAVHPVGMLALAWDHRAFDGAYAAAFMARVKEIIETRDWAQEL